MSSFDPDGDFIAAHEAALSALSRGEDASAAAARAICPSRDLDFSEQTICRLAVERALADWAHDNRKKEAA